MFISPKTKYNPNKFLKSQLINKKKTKIPADTFMPNNICNILFRNGF